MSRFTTPIPTRGPAGNIFAMLGTASGMMRELELPAAEIDAFRKRVMGAGNYSAACAVIEEYFPLDRDGD